MYYTDQLWGKKAENPIITEIFVISVYIDGWSYWHGASSVGWHGRSLWGDVGISWHGCRCPSVPSHGWVGRWCAGVSRHWLTRVAHPWSLSLGHGSSWLWIQAMLVRERGTIPVRLKGARVQPWGLGDHEWGWCEPPHDWRGLRGLWCEEISMPEYLMRWFYDSCRSHLFWMTVRFNNDIINVNNFVAP